MKRSQWLFAAAVAVGFCWSETPANAQCDSPVKEGCSQPVATYFNNQSAVGGSISDSGCSSAVGTGSACDSAIGGCGTGCDSAIGSCGSGCGCGGGILGGGLLSRFGGMGAGLMSRIQPSDHCFDDFISPITNPTYFEDPRTLTEARFIYLRHKVPVAAAGGDVQLFALQLRAALSQRLSIIATKDGYIFSDNPLIQEGWADIAAGLKYNLIRDPAGQRLLSAGMTYELDSGTTRSLQGNGNGVFNLFLSHARKLNECANYMSTLGVRLPRDTAAETSMMYWSHHVDRRISDRLFLLAEANWYNWLDSGAGGINGVEGGDLFNLGSTGVTGNDIVTAAIGLKLKPSYNQEIGFAWELPVTKREDVLDNRLTFDWIVRY